MVSAGTEGELLTDEPAAPLVGEAAPVVEQASKKDKARKPNRRRKLPCRASPSRECRVARKQHDDGQRTSADSSQSLENGLAATQGDGA